MFKYYFEQIHNVEVWPIFSLALFMTFFIGLLIWVFTTKKAYIHHMENLPNDDGCISIPKSINHEKEN